jgi:hypothetical protein
MIQLKTIRIEEFRGIRELELDLGCNSFVVWGPNGSGKSGVVDAIDFALTGSIARLTGAGTAGITVLKHGPHIHRRDNAAAARVILTVVDTTSGQEATLTRCVKTAGQFTLNPDTPEIRAAVTRAQDHPELVLSRREIIKYIVAEAGKRAQEVQALLKLDRIDQVRRLLKTAMTKATGELNTASAELDGAEDAMQRHLDLPKLLVAEVTNEINKRRRVLGLDEFDAIAIETDVTDGVGDSDAAPTFDKAGAIREVKLLVDMLAEPKDLKAASADLVQTLDELSVDPELLTALRHRSLVEAGIDLVSGPACPLCDVAWDDIEGLRAHLQDKLTRSQAADELQRRILAAATTVRAELRTIRELARGVHRYAQTDGGTELPHRIQSWVDDLIRLESTTEGVEGAAAARDRFDTDPLAVDGDLRADISSLLTALEAKPDLTATAEARRFLTVANERWTRVRLARAGRAKATAGQATAKAVYDTYCATADQALTTLYKSVEDDFGTYYRQINSDDEGTFTAALDPSAGKLDLEVDFYGIGMYPPAAYHSEGHQDGMGVCLYLALVKQLLGTNFRFAVLDDVVMSVDTNHRRQFCKLLKESFPDVQFVITTHDAVWARQMQTDGLISRDAQAHFYGWTVDDGPVYEQGGDVWSRIDADLAADDVSGAAHKLRRHMEAVTADIAASIQARVAYRPDASYDLGELLGAVTGRHGELLKKAKASATAWKNEAATQKVAELAKARARVVPAQQTESWVINKLVHNNDWAVLSASDLVPVLEACKSFLALFQCAGCNGTIYVSGRPGAEEALRCSCGALLLNLLAK